MSLTMKEKTGLEMIWAGCDNLLLLSVVVLLGVLWYSTDRDGFVMAAPVSELTATYDPPSGRRPHTPPSVPVEGLRVSQNRQRVNMIARSMIDSDWEQVPPCPAMDMREVGKTYEVLFSLPDDVAEDSVAVSAAGNVLTLTMKACGTGKMYVQRIRVPCGVERYDSVETAISNAVLRIRINPVAAGG